MPPDSVRRDIHRKAAARFRGIFRALGAIAWALALFNGTLRASQDEGTDSSWFSFFSSDKSRPSLVGDEVCSTCHAAKAHSFHLTAHAKTSSLANLTTIHGRFEPETNVLRTANPSLTFVMEASEGSFRQTAHMKNSPTEELTRSEQIDIVVGSGRKGQSYLYWDGDKLFQLPVSYWTELDGWINSPGYVDGTAEFERPINPRCLECHASFFDNRSAPSNRYDPASLILGIACEKCHGPGGEHVARFRSASPPTDPASFAIVNPARLPRDRQIDICALCHAGGGESLRPPLSFSPGDVLAHDIAFARLPPSAHVDVHASQVQLLERSRCFRSSPGLTCLTCHDVHLPQRDPAAYAPKCLGCHTVQACGIFPAAGHSIDSRCVDCHMPLQETTKIISRTDGQSVHPKVRNHQIAIYSTRAPP